MIVKSLDRKILIALSLSVALITAVIIYFTNHRLSKQILEEFIYDRSATTERSWLSRNPERALKQIGFYWLLVNEQAPR